MWINSFIIFSMIFIVPWTNYLEERTYISDMLSVAVIIITGFVFLLVKYFYDKNKLKFSWTQVAESFLVDFLGKGLIVVWIILSLNFYFRDEMTTTVTKKIEDNFKKGPNGIRSVIISNPYKMIDIGKDYDEYIYIKLTLSKGLLGFEIIEHYDLRF